MKDLTLSAVAVVALALALGLGFHWVYPRVELTAELAGLFGFVALLLRLVLGKLWSLRQKPAVPATPSSATAPAPAPAPASAPAAEPGP